MRILVTGASGFLGRSVTGSLLSGGHEVGALVRKADALPDANFSVAVADLRASREVDAAVRSFAPECVVHLAAHITSESKDQSELFDNNVAGISNLLQACLKLSAPPRVVYTSSMSVYDYANPLRLPVDETHPLKPQGQYGASKWVGELLCRQYGSALSAACIILRLPGLYGPRRKKGLIYNLVRAAREGSTVTAGCPDIRRDFLYVEDAALAVSKSIGSIDDTRPLTINVAAGGHSLSELVKTVARVSGRRVQVDFGTSEGSDFYFDPATAEQALGFCARPLREALTDFCAGLDGGN